MGGRGARISIGPYAAQDKEVPQTASGLLAWIDGTCEWELNRLPGVDYPLPPPDAAIPPEEDAVSIDAAMAMRATFARDLQ